MATTLQKEIAKVLYMHLSDSECMKLKQEITSEAVNHLKETFEEVLVLGVYPIMHHIVELVNDTKLTLRQRQVNHLTHYYKSEGWQLHLDNTMVRSTSNAKYKMTFTETKVITEQLRFPFNGPPHWLKCGESDIDFLSRITGGPC